MPVAGICHSLINHVAGICPSCPLCPYLPHVPVLRGRRMSLTNKSWPGAGICASLMHYICGRHMSLPHALRGRRMSLPHKSCGRHMSLTHRIKALFMWQIDHPMHRSVGIHIPLSHIFHSPCIRWQTYVHVPYTSPCNSELERTRPKKGTKPSGKCTQRHIKMSS